MGQKRQRIRKQVKQTGINPKEAASCYGKIRHTKDEAYQRANGLSTMKAYKCEFCPHYHVGRAPWRKK